MRFLGKTKLQQLQQLKEEEELLLVELRVKNLRDKLHSLSPTGGVMRWIKYAIVGGLLSILVYASQHLPNVAQVVSILAVGVGVAVASLSVGGLLGLIFGVPRAYQHERDTSPSPDRYQPNTNLEQVSDWLAKVLVGVGLTQLLTIPDRLSELMDTLKPGLGNTDSSRPFALAEVLLFTICGFLFSYLWTRLILLGRLTHAELEAEGLGATETTPRSTT